MMKLRNSLITCLMFMLIISGLGAVLFIQQEANEQSLQLPTRIVLPSLTPEEIIQTTVESQPALPETSLEIASASITIESTPSNYLSNEASSPFESQVVPNQFILRFNSDINSVEIQSFVADLISENNGQVVERIPVLNTIIMRFDQPVDPSSIFDNDLLVDTQSDYQLRIASEILPNDPQINLQWALPYINAPSAWDTFEESQLVTVAVIDSGLDLSNSEFTDVLTEGYDYVDDDFTPQDENGHGTAVSGVLGARHDNGIGISGVAPNSRIMPLRVLDQNGIGTYSDVAAAIVHAVDSGAQIVNLSLGGTEESSLLEAAINYAVQNNVLVIAASGNTGSEQILFPAAYESVISVGAIAQNGQQASFSSNNESIDIWAPGINIYTTILANNFDYLSGTSIAVPHVAGIAALEIAHGGSLVVDGGVLRFSGSDRTVPDVPISVPIMDEPLIDPAVLNAIQRDGEVSVIIALHENVTSQSTDHNVRLQSISTTQRNVMSMLSTDVFTTEHIYRNAYGLSGTLTEAGLNILSTHPDVAVITLNPAIYSHNTVNYDYIEAETARLNFDVTGAGVTVAVVDTGVFAGHADFGGRVDTDNICSQRFGHQDLVGHGTNVAGIIAGMDGIAPNAQIIPINVFPHPGSGRLGDLIAVLDCLLETLPQSSVDIINMSLGAAQILPGDCDADFRQSFPVALDIINQLSGNGVIMVASSGNQGSQQGINFPGCLNQVISVGAVYATPPEASLDDPNSSDGNASYVGYGSGWTDCYDQNVQVGEVTCFTNLSSALDLLAPGVNVPAPFLNNGEFASYTGTSQAAPMVSGVIALMLERNPNLSLDQVRQLLISGGTDAINAPQPILNAVNTLELIPFDPCSNVTDIPSTECGALVDFYNGTGGISWTNSEGWLQTDDVCDWFGLLCSEGHVIQLQLSNNNLSGSFPSMFLRLPQLRVVDLSFNNLQGYLSPYLNQLVDLRTLRLNNNTFIGTIPNTFGQISTLETLNLSSNNLTGNIPPMPSVQLLDLSNNPLGSSITASIGLNTALQYLDLANTNLTGSVPDQIGNLSNLRTLELSDNLLIGAIPPSLGNLGNIQSINLSNNLFTGVIPDSLGNLALLNLLDLSFNALTGTIPASFSNAVSLSVFNVNNNALSGEIPSDISQLSAFLARLNPCPVGVNPYENREPFVVVDIDTGVDDIASLSINSISDCTDNLQSNSVISVDGGFAYGKNLEDGDYEPWILTYIATGTTSTYSPQGLINEDCSNPRNGIVSNPRVIPIIGGTAYDFTTQIRLISSTGSLTERFEIIPLAIRVDSDVHHLFENYLVNRCLAEQNGQTNFPGLSRGPGSAFANALNTPGMPLAFEYETARVSTTTVTQIDPCPIDFDPYADRNLFDTLPADFGSMAFPDDCAEDLTTSPVPVRASGNFALSALTANYEPWVIVYTADALTPRYYPQGLIDGGCVNPRGADISDHPTNITLRRWETDVYFGSAENPRAERFEVVLLAINTTTGLDEFLRNYLQEGCIASANGDEDAFAGLTREPGSEFADLLETGFLEAPSAVEEDSARVSTIIDRRQFNLSMNGLYTEDTQLRAFLSEVAPGWDTSQLAQVTDVILDPLSANSFQLSWSPIDTVFSEIGHYEILQLPAEHIVQITSNLQSTQIALTGLNAGTQYTYGVRAVNTLRRDHNGDGILDVEVEISGRISESVSATTEASACTNVVGMPVEECEALEALYNSTNGDNWTINTGWWEDNLLCNWYGIICEDDHITELSLGNNNLNGELPSALGSLTELRVLELRDNILQGEVPSEIGNLLELSTLDLGINDLTGSIPPELGSLVQLNQLDLDSNQLIDDIPIELGNLTALNQLDFDVNHLTGAIPETFENLTQLTELGLAQNRLFGEIPEFINLFTQLTSVNIGGNQFEGDVPDTIITLPLDIVGINEFSYNMLTSENVDVIAYLEAIDPGWQDTQTIPPDNVQLFRPSTNASSSLRVTWDVIPYVADGGYYEVLYATDENGPYIVHGQTDNKTVNTYLLDGLERLTTYYVQVRTFTPSHANNQNDLLSLPSVAVSGTTALQDHIVTGPEVGINVVVDENPNDEIEGCGFDPTGRYSSYFYTGTLPQYFVNQMTTVRYDLTSNDIVPIMSVHRLNADNTIGEEIQCVESAVPGTTISIEIDVHLGNDIVVIIADNAGNGGNANLEIEFLPDVVGALPYVGDTTTGDSGGDLGGLDCPNAFDPTGRYSSYFYTGRYSSYFYNGSGDFEITVETDEITPIIAVVQVINGQIVAVVDCQISPDIGTDSIVVTLQEGQDYLIIVVGNGGMIGDFTVVIDTAVDGVIINALDDPITSTIDEATGLIPECGVNPSGRYSSYFYTGRYSSYFYNGSGDFEFRAITDAFDPIIAVYRIDPATGNLELLGCVESNVYSANNVNYGDNLVVVVRANNNGRGAFSFVASYTGSPLSINELPYEVTSFVDHVEGEYQPSCLTETTGQFEALLDTSNFQNLFETGQTDIHINVTTTAFTPVVSVVEVGAETNTEIFCGVFNEPQPITRRISLRLNASKQYRLIIRAPHGSRGEFRVNVDATPTEECNLNASSYLTGTISEDGTSATVMNASETCTYRVGMASYRMFDNRIDTQQIFDWQEPTLLGSLQTMQLNVNVPSCASQIDVFYGNVLMTLNGNRYGTRLIDGHLINQDSPCQIASIEECTIGGLSITGLLPNQVIIESVNILAALEGPDRPSRVVFNLMGSRMETHTETTPPYFWLGNEGDVGRGWGVSDYPHGDYSFTVQAYQGGFVCSETTIPFSIATNEQPPVPDNGSPVEVIEDIEGQIEATPEITPDSAPPLVDGDGDGYNSNVDCNDQDSTIYPGANDTAGDGIDQDCDGIDSALVVIPIAEEETIPLPIDNDNDGSVSDLDCNDQDSTIYPGANDIAGDGIDQDCDGLDAVPNNLPPTEVTPEVTTEP